MPSRGFQTAASTLAGVGRRFYARGWVLGTSGNFSAVVSKRPLQLAISASGTSKRVIGAGDFLCCDDRGRAIGRAAGKIGGSRRAALSGLPRKPSAETLLHVEIVRQYEQFVETLGDRYLRDVRDLRTGDHWNEALLRLIDAADVFQGVCLDLVNELPEHRILR